ncbi:unnamed protein product, partial [Scytosiphon promiscuus]
MTAPGPPAGDSSVAGNPPRRITIGILALQGAFAEHSTFLSKLGADVREVRLPHEFDGLDGIVLPGGESTAMALIGERWGVFPRLKQWVSEGRPVWGTCAGMILLSDNALMQKEGGQSLVGGLNVEVCRNYFGAQKSSFEVPLDTSVLEVGAEGEKLAEAAKKTPYPAVFIRAPAVLEVGPGVDILCKVRARPCDKAVTARAKRRRLATFFVESGSPRGHRCHPQGQHCWHRVPPRAHGRLALARVLRQDCQGGRGRLRERRRERGGSFGDACRRSRKHR